MGKQSKTAQRSGARHVPNRYPTSCVASIITTSLPINERQDTPSKRRRRKHSPMFKCELVASSLLPGTSVAAVALEVGINSNLLFAWRRMHLSAQERPPTLAPSDPSPMLQPVNQRAAIALP